MTCKVLLGYWMISHGTRTPCLTYLGRLLFSHTPYLWEGINSSRKGSSSLPPLVLRQNMAKSFPPPSCQFSIHAAQCNVRVCRVWPQEVVRPSRSESQSWRTNPLVKLGEPGTWTFLFIFFRGFNNNLETAGQLLYSMTV